MDDEQKRPSENSDADSSLARAADPPVHMQVVVFVPPGDARDNVMPPIAWRHPEIHDAPADPVTASSIVPDEQSLRDELLGNDSLGG